MPRLLKPVHRTSQTPVYGIGAASRLTGIPIWTLRWIEKNSLVRPRRTAGNQRMFSEEDVRRLERIRGLLAEKVNLAGIRVVLRAEGRA